MKTEEQNVTPAEAATEVGHEDAGDDVLDVLTIVLKIVSIGVILFVIWVMK